MNRLAAMMACACLAACSLPGPREPDRYLILDAALAPRAGPPVTVAPMTAASFYDTQEIAYSRAGGARAYYRFNHWTERPQRSIQAQLAARLEAAGATGGLRLRTHLDEIYHDAVQSPGVARIAVTAELVDPAGFAVRARRTFRSEAPAASYDAPGAVAGFNRALATLIGEIEAWVDAESRPK